MPSVYVFGAGASCEYRGVVGAFFLDNNFFDIVDLMWAGWLSAGAPVDGAPGLTHAPGHYNGQPWRWPDLEGLLIRTCGADYRLMGLERTYTRVSALGLGEGELFLRCIELALFHQLRAVEPRNMPAHIEFMRRAVRPGDVLITFNYDPLLELALSQVAGEPGSVLRWHEGDGYGIDVVPLSGVAQGENTEPSNVRLLKLHGSVDWLSRAGESPTPPFKALRVIPDSFRGQGFIARDNLRPVIVPPLPEKDYEAMGLLPLWNAAEQALGTAASLTVIGYSLPATDGGAKELLRGAATTLGNKVPATFVTRARGAAFERFRAIFPEATLSPGGFASFVRSLP